MPKTLIPYGNRILVRKKKVGDKIGGEGLIFAPDSIKERDTDLAIVVYVPDSSFIDNELFSEAEAIVKGLSVKAKEGNADAFQSLLNFNQYLLIKNIKPGDEVLVSKYAGVTFHDNKGSGDVTLIAGEDIIGIVRSENVAVVRDLQEVTR